MIEMDPEPPKSKLTNEQLRALGESDTLLLDIEPGTGISSIAHGLTNYEYHMAMIYRQAARRERAEWRARMERMAKVAMNRKPS